MFMNIHSTVQFVDIKTIEREVTTSTAMQNTQKVHAHSPQPSYGDFSK